MLISLLPLRAGTAQDGLPPGFSDEAVVDVPVPTALAFTPDGRMLIASKSGQLRIRDDAGSTATVALDISAKVCSAGERGLLGVAVDPDFATTGRVFVYYTFKKYGDCPRNVARGPVNRVSRFVMRGDRVVESTEKVLIDNVPSRRGNHNAGDLEFGRDGFLYVSIGDSGCDLAFSDRCAEANGNARHPELLLGKIARITADGGIPRTNPYTDPATSARCALTGRTTVGKRCQETFASGLRNPFRFAFDPNAAGTRFVINDVGNRTWEEIDEGRKGADYGWNAREGFCATGIACGTSGRATGPYTDPIHTYPHTSNCSSITGGAFVPNGVWPAAYDGSYLFADYVCGGIYRLPSDGAGGFRTPGPNDNVVGVPFVRPNDGSPVHLRFGPHGATQALYYTSFVGGGQIRRISYAAGVNRAPIARLATNPTEGTTPLAVSFDGGDSTDPDGDAMSFVWDFGDGSPVETGTAAQTEHVYNDAEQFSVTLTVADAAGRTDRATVAIDAGNQLPRAVVDSPTATTRFAVGEQIELTGHAEDASGTSIPDAVLGWEVLLHHNTHVHPFLEESGSLIAFEAPSPENLDAAKNGYLEVRLTVTTAAGTSRTVSRDLQPATVDLTFVSSPPDLEFRVNETVVRDGGTVTSWAGWNLRLDAPRQPAAAGRFYDWVSWGDGSPTAARTLTTPAGPAQVDAAFRLISVVPAVADARVQRARPDANDGRGRSLSAVGGRTTRTESYLRFDVPTLPGSVRSATLRVWVPNTPGAGTVNGPTLVGVDNRWSEETISWNRRPARMGPMVDDAGRVGHGLWVEFDVTRLVKGRGPVSVALISASRDGVIFSSREGPRPPELIVVAADTPPTAGSARFLGSTIGGGRFFGSEQVVGVRAGFRGREP